MFADLILRCRSYRRFVESETLERQTLVELVNLARCSASGGNNQPLKYMVFNEPNDAARIFPHLQWAGALTDWDGPGEGERPAAYIVILLDKQIKEAGGVDHGIAGWSIMLGATDRGYGGCLVGAIERTGLQAELELDDRYGILLVCALGKPAEKVVLEDAPPGGDVTYYRDEDDVHHVPKRAIDELIIN
jgi:nitroreductase